MPSSYSDSEIVANIRAGGQLRERCIAYLIQHHTSFIYSIHRKLGLAEELAQDAFTDAIMVLVQHINTEHFRGDSKVSTYLYRIFFNKSVDLVRKNTTKKVVATTYEMPQVADREQDLLRKLSVREEFARIGQYMDQLGQKCKQILMDWGFWGYKMSEIAERVGLQTADQAKKQKYKCLQKLTKLIKAQKT